MAKAIRFFELNTGAKIPSVGLGTWQADPGVVAVTTAIKVGYRHIDCAQAYQNEKETISSCPPATALKNKFIGERVVISDAIEMSVAYKFVLMRHGIGTALQKLFSEGVVKREDLWITSKLWCTDHAPEDVPKALDTTLENLQLEYLDLYLIHWPVSMRKGSVGFKPENLTQPDIPSTWKAMEALYRSGKARAIGVSNFSSKKLGDLLDIAEVPPAVNQVECHPYWQQGKLREFCKSRGVHLSGYSPLGSPGTGSIKSDILKNPVITTIAEKLGKTPAQVALRWGLQMGHSVLPKSTNEARIKENFDVFDWSIPDDLFCKLSEVPQDKLIKGTGFVHETLSAYKTVQELWDGEV